MRQFLRDADWLTQDRVLAYSRILLVMGAAGFAAAIRWHDAALPIAHDFAAFWTGANLALHGHAADAYGDAGRRAMVAILGPGARPPFFYSPVALLLWLPFALLPIGLAAAIWVAATAAAYALTLRRLLPKPALTILLAYPAVTICALFGQNGLFSAALFGGAALTLDRAPITAGILIGCLAYKPQLGILAPIALLCARRFTALAAAAATVAILAAISTAAFGTASWRAFLDALPVATAWNTSGIPGFAIFVTPYSALRLLGASSPAAWTAQIIAALAAAAILAIIALRRPGGTAETALLVAATGFCVPFLGEYDLALFAVPGAWIAAEAMRTRWLPYEASLLALLYLSPAMIKAAATNGIPLAPACLAVLAALILRRIIQSPAPEQPG